MLILLRGCCGHAAISELALGISAPANLGGDVRPIRGVTDRVSEPFGLVRFGLRREVAVSVTRIVGSLGICYGVV